MRELSRTLGDVIHVLRVRRWSFIIPFCLAASAALLVSLYVPRTYSTSVLFERIDDPVLRGLPQGQGVTAFDYFRRILPREIKTPEVMGPIMEHLGLAAAWPRNSDGDLSPEGLAARALDVEKLASHISVEWWERSEHSDTVALKYQGDNPLIMVPLVEQMRDAYVRLARAKLRETLASTRQVYESLAAEEKRHIDQIDQELTEFKMHNPGIDPTDPDTITYQLTLLRARLEELERERGQLNRELALQQNFLADGLSPIWPSPTPSPVAPADSPAILRLKNQVFELEQQMTELRLTRGMTDLHPHMIELKNRRDQAASDLDQIRQAPGIVPGATSSGVESDVWTLARRQAEMEQASIEARIDETDRANRVTADSIARYERMQANVFLNRKVYLERAEALSDARAEYLKHKAQIQELTRRLTVEEMDKGIQFATVEPAKADFLATSPSVKTVFAMALLVGGAVAAGCVMLRELFDRRVRSPEQIAHYLGLPVLECIGEIATAAERRHRFWRRAVLLPVVVGILICTMSGSAFLAYCSLARPDWYATLVRRTASAPFTTVSQAILINHPGKELGSWGG